MVDKKKLRKQRKAKALRELAAMAESRIGDMPPLKKIEDGPTHRGIAQALKRTAERVENE
jgi:hypothetical protein